MRAVEIGKRLFARTRAERVLGISRTNVRESENLARVVDCLAKRVGRVYGQRILHETSSIARLQRMVSRMGAIVPHRNTVPNLQPSVANGFVDKQSCGIVRAALEPNTRRQ